MVSSTVGRVHVPMRVAAACAHITNRLSTYDPNGVVTSVLCVSMNVPLPPNNVPISEWVFFDRETHQLWSRILMPDVNYRHEAISMEMLREGEFRVPRYTWDDVRHMVDMTDMTDENTNVPTHVMESMKMVRGLSLPVKLAGAVIVGGDILKESGHSCLVNKPTDPCYFGVGLMQVIKGQPPFAVIANIADYFIERKGRVWIFKF